MTLPAHQLTMTVLMTPDTANFAGNVHGGNILKLLDQVAYACASRYAGRYVVTLSVDRVIFRQPVHVGDILRTMAQVNWAGRTSMEIGVRVETERWNEATGQPLHVASAYLVFVAIDEHGAAREIPALEPETERERRRVREAEIRRSHRLARKQEIEEGRTGAP